MVSTTPAWGMEPTTSSLGAMSHYHQAKARGACLEDTPFEAQHSPFNNEQGESAANTLPKPVGVNHQ
jgi:hypothetical protein